METDSHTCKKGCEKGNELININIETHRSLINCSDSNCPDGGSSINVILKGINN